MTTGIIIICHNNEFDIKKEECIHYFNQLTDIEFCLVNNNSADNTHELLKDLSDVCKNVSVVNVNTYKTSTSAVRAGARFMFNEYNLKQLGFITTKTIDYFENFENLLSTLIENQDLICNYNRYTLEKKEIKLTLFQRLFSVVDYLPTKVTANLASTKKRLQPN